MWNINGIKYCGVPFMVLSQKTLDCSHGIDRKEEVKKKFKLSKSNKNVSLIRFSITNI